MSAFRIQRLVGRDAGERLEGYDANYRCYRDELPLYQGHVSRWCTKPSEFMSLDDKPTNSFILKPSRRYMPFTWLVNARNTGQLQGTLKRKLLGKVDWIIRDAHSAEVARFRGRYNPRFWLFRIMDFFVGSLPDGYEIVANGITIARMEKEKRPKTPEKNQKAGFLKFISKVMNGSDWVIREENGYESQINHRLLVSGAVLLHQISRDISI